MFFSMFRQLFMTSRRKGVGHLARQGVELRLEPAEIVQLVAKIQVRKCVSERESV